MGGQKNIVVCFSLPLCVCVCVCDCMRELEHSVNWNHPTAPCCCQHKLKLGCCSIKSETGRQSASWLRPGLAPLTLNAYSCLPICLLYITRELFIKTFLISAEGSATSHGLFQSGFAWGQQSLIGPTTRLSYFQRVVVTHSTVKGRELRKEKTSEGADEVVLDPGNVNIEALHQGLASTATHLFFPQPLENGTEMNL